MKPTHLVAIAASSALILSACATKRYAISTELSPVEIEFMDCNALQLELIRAEQVQSQISDTAQTDWRSAAGFLGDFGIGNAMAKSEAEKKLSDRVHSIRGAQATKGCLTSDS